MKYRVTHYSSPQEVVVAAGGDDINYMRRVFGEVVSMVSASLADRQTKHVTLEAMTPAGWFVSTIAHVHQNL